SFLTGNFNGNSAARYTSGNIPGIPANPINDPTYTVTVTVNSVSPNRNVSFFFKNDGIACGGPGQVINGGGSTGVYTFTETALSGYDPANGFCFWLFSFDGAITVSYAVNIAITYPGAAAITFPSVDYNDCVFGTPVLIQCTPDCNFLPVELTSFTGKKLDNQVQLDWTTAAEVNHDYFSVERSTTGREFYPFDRVLGNGDSSTPKAYTSFDRNPNNGINYYRLVQHDLDGTTTNSRTIAIDFKAEATVKIIPNPVTENNFTVNYFSEKEGPVLLELFDVAGKLLQTRNWSVTNGDNNLEMNISDYGSGVYLLRSTQAGQTLVTRLVKK
ncbi:MAG: T9SS type A sorting domain-containing protein, partial [Saprospiraceae bacterium]